MVLWGKGSKGIGSYEEDWVMNPSLQTRINVPSNVATQINYIFSFKSIVMFFDIFKKPGCISTKQTQG